MSMSVLLLNKTDNSISLYQIDTRHDKLALCEGCLIAATRIHNLTFSDCVKVFQGVREYVVLTNTDRRSIEVYAL